MRDRVGTGEGGGKRIDASVARVMCVVVGLRGSWLGSDVALGSRSFHGSNFVA